MHCSNAAQFVEMLPMTFAPPIQNLIVEVRALVLHTFNESESIEFAPTG
jgi:hypothetical protein